MRTQILLESEGKKEVEMGGKTMNKNSYPDHDQKLQQLVEKTCRQNNFLSELNTKKTKSSFILTKKALNKMPNSNLWAKH